jgi:hypothetical protein
MITKKHKGPRIAGFVLLGIGFVALVIYVVMLLWNWLVPELFSGPEIGYWQSAGLLLLSKIIFTGFHGHSREKSHDRKMKEFWRKRFDEKWNSKKMEAEGGVNE